MIKQEIEACSDPESKNSLIRNLEVTNMFLEQVVKNKWSPEEINKKAEALYYTNSTLLKQHNSKTLK